MKNLLISLGLGALISVAFTASSLLTAGIRSSRCHGRDSVVLCLGEKQGNGGTFASVTKELKHAPRTANALKVLEEARGIAKAQIGLEVQLDNQIGMIHFMQQDFGQPCPFSSVLDASDTGWAQ